MSRKRTQTPIYLVSIIIPTYLRFDLLKKCLDAIPDAFGDIPYEIILVENGTPREDKLKFFSSTFYQVPSNMKVIELPIKEGFAAACNRGYKSSSGSLLFFLNDDVIMEKGSGEKLVMAMDDPTVGIAGMKLLFPSEEELFDAQLSHSESNRPAGKIQHVGLSTNLRGQVFHLYLGWSADNPRVNAVMDVFAVTGAALMVRRALFHKVSGFDVAYGAGSYEDVDLCMKIKELGARVIVEVAAVGKHYTGATAEGYKIGFPLNQNKSIFEQKWYNKLTWQEWVHW